MFGGWLKGTIKSSGLAEFHFERPYLSRELAVAFENGRHLLIYGPPRQGKSTLVRKGLGDRDSITVHASPEITFADVFRAYLLTLGCSLTVERVKKRKLGTTAEVKFPWPLPLTAKAEADLEGEVTLRHFTADINSVNDVCFLLKQMGRVPCLVLDRFEQMGRKQRRAMIDSLAAFSENTTLRIIIIATTSEFPLDYREQIEVSRHLSVVHVPRMNADESTRCVNAVLRKLGSTAAPNLSSTLFEFFHGSLDLTIEGCLLAASKPASSGDITISESPSIDRLVEAIHSQTQAYFLDLVKATMGQKWQLTCAKRLSREPQNPTGALEASQEFPSVQINPALTGDGVFRSLGTVLSSSKKEMPAMSSAVRPLFNLARELGRQILRVDVQSEAVRFLAFAIAQMLSNPMSETHVGYEPAYSRQLFTINLGTLFCELLLETNSEESVVLDQSRLEAQVAKRGLTVLRFGEKEYWFPALARKVRKLQKKLNIDPPIFKVYNDLMSITLWEPASLLLFGDLKAKIKELLEEHEEEEELSLA
jgi:hypothetical protein